MAKYRVEVAYRTKREGFCVGMTVDAFNDTDAADIAEAKVLKGYPARKWIFTHVSEEKADKS